MERKYLLRSLGILGCTLLVGCVAHAKFGTPQDNIMSALQTDLKTDKSVQGRTAPPQNINQA
ncbi:MAG: hypothetical protein SFW07_07790, partial [Gammaproteobacteria bacterium]|nr:hypothetical protein [Gammaproteobacteria bacterium]